jgi:ribosomal protein S18 acetylase RimI-like enzyme
MLVVPAVIEDAHAIATVQIRSWQAAYAGILDPGWLQSLSIEERARRWQEILAANESRTLVCRDEGTVTGFVSLGKCRDEGAPESQGEIWALYAAPEVWGQGAGRALLERAIRDLNSSGLTTVSLWVLKENHRGIRFYETCGFVRAAGNGKIIEIGGREVEEVAYLLG